MAVKEMKYPFMDGCKNLPTGKDELIKELRDWMATQPHLPQISDEFLHLFLHSNYDDVEKSKQTIECYFTMRATHTELFSDRSPSSPAIQSVWEMLNIVPLEKRTPEGYQVLICKYSDPDINKFNHLNIIKTLDLVQDVLISENGLSPGFVMVQDMEGGTWQHFLKQNWSIARANMKFVQEGLPLRLKGFHVLHAPSFMNTMLNLVKPLLKKELLELMHIHTTDFTEFYTYVPREILPSNYGGPNENMQVQHDKFVNKIKTKYEVWVDNEKEPKADMSKHPKNTRKSYFSFW